jgi:hypothetical protein
LLPAGSCLLFEMVVAKFALELVLLLGLKVLALTGETDQR